MRSGRVIAFRLKAVCCTPPAYPSTSLVMSICHPKLSQFRSTATTWGCEHESEARAKYKTLYDLLHRQFSISNCGLFLHHDYPFIGASPDGLVSCLCCGKGICEVKVCMIMQCTHNSFVFKHCFLMCIVPILMLPSIY